VADTLLAEPAGDRTSTPQRILDAAERLFAEKGFAGTSLREVTALAGVNVAAVHYHFGSKDELLRAVLSRIVEPVNRERLELLERAEADAAPRPPPIEAILEAFIAPDLRVIRDLGERGAVITRFIGRSYTEPTELVRRMVAEQFGELGLRFHRALCRAVPDVPPQELYWRLMAVVGVITYMLATTSEGERGQLLEPDDVEGTLQRMVTFLAPGLVAPAPRRKGPSRRHVQSPAREPR
jgi:AcrR family transcriptional regulator